MNLKHHLAAAYGGIFFVVLFGIGWALLAGFVPPPPAGASGADIAAFYQAHNSNIILGLIVVMIGIAGLLPFMAVVSMQMARIEGRWPILALSQIVIGVINTLLLLIPVVLWIAVAFRPDRDPELMRLLNDAGWMFMLWPFSTATLQNILIGVCILSDKHVVPIFPRWVGYFNLWTSLMIAPGGIMPFFKTGPFAWNGLFAFWMAACTYLIWISVLMVMTIRAVKQHAQEEGAV